MSVNLYPPTFTPTGLDEQENTPIKMGFAFTVTAPTTIHGIRWLSPAVQPGAYVQLYENDTPLVQQNADLALGSNDIIFQAAQNLLVGHNYEIVIGTDPDFGGTLPFHYDFASGWAGGTFGPIVIPDPPGRFAYGVDSGVDSPPTQTGVANYGVQLLQTVAEPVTLSVTATSPVSGTLGDTIALAAVAHDAVGSVSWAWTQLSGATQTLSSTTIASPEVTPDAVGTFVFRATATDDDGSAHADVTVTVAPAPAPTLVLWVRDSVDGEWHPMATGSGGEDLHPKPWVFHPADFGAVGDDVTDDTAALRACFAAAVAYGISSGRYHAEIAFDSHSYLVSAPTVKGGATFGNAQLPLPVVPDTGRKFTLTLRGVGDASTFAHWKQSVPQSAGTVIRSTLTGQTPDATWGPPSVIGGPTKYFQDDGTTYRFSNMLLRPEGVTVQAPPNPSVIGWDLSQIGEVDATSIAATVSASPAGTPDLEILPTNTNGLGIFFPREQNNARAQAEAVVVQGFYYGIAGSEHLTITTLGLVYGVVGLFARGAGNSHGIAILEATIEAFDTYIQYTGDGHLPIFIGLLNGEGVRESFVAHVDDPNDGLYGEIRVADIYKPATMIGGKHLRLLDAQRPLGPVTAPALPNSTVALRNEFYRDATVVVAGGTVTRIAVDGIDQHVTAGAVRVPTGHTIAITYSIAPTWTWQLE